VSLGTRVRAILMTLARRRPRPYLGYFEDVETQRNSRLARYAFTCVAVILACLAHNYFVMPDMFLQEAIGCLCISAPLLLIAGILARRNHRATAEILVLISFSVLPVWTFWFFTASTIDRSTVALYGLSISCLMFIWYNATFGARLWKPVVCYLVVCAAALTMFQRIRGLSWEIHVSLSLLVLSSAGMALLSNLFMHRDERGSVSESQRLLAAIAAGRHDLWAFDIPTDHVEMLRAGPSGSRRRARMAYSDYLAMVHSEDRQYVLKYIGDCIDRGMAQEPCQYRMRRSRNEWLWCEASGKVVERDRNGRPLVVLGMTHNISDRKELTRQIQQQAGEIARATRAKSEFLATMSHEIRTPLNGVLGMASLLADAALTTHQREMVAIIRDSGSTLLQILNDVLDFSKIEAGKLSLAVAPFEVREVAAHCMQDVEESVRKKSLTTGLSVADNVPQWVVGDAVHLNTILTHLLSNAVKFTSIGRVDLEISTVDPDGHGAGTLRFEVRDTGIGMGLESQKRLFAPFTHAHGRGYAGNSGVGLGLALSKRLVEALGGSIACSSEPTRGTSFVVALPLATCERPVSAQLEVCRALPAERVRILVAEDNPVNQTVLVRMLKRLGYSASMVANGQEAVDAARDGTFDVVLMDCEMPLLDGLEATRRIRELPGRQNLPIIALSAHSPGDHKALCTAAGMSDYLTKPITSAALRQGLTRWL